MRWLMLLMSLPPTPTRHRVGVWRKLQRMGAVRLRGSAWILPETPETTELFQWLAEESQFLPRGTPRDQQRRDTTAYGEKGGECFGYAQGGRRQAVGAESREGRPLRR